MGRIEDPRMVAIFKSADKSGDLWAAFTAARGDEWGTWGNCQRRYKQRAQAAPPTTPAPLAAAPPASNATGATGSRGSAGGRGRDGGTAAAAAAPASSERTGVTKTKTLRHVLHCSWLVLRLTDPNLRLSPLQ